MVDSATIASRFSGVDATLPIIEGFRHYDGCTIPGVSKNNNSVEPTERRPSIERRVVFGLLLTAETFSPTSAFSRVLFPTFGAPQSPMVRKRGSSSFYHQHSTESKTRGSSFFSSIR